MNVADREQALLDRYEGLLRKAVRQRHSPVHFSHGAESGGMGEVIVVGRITGRKTTVNDSLGNLRSFYPEALLIQAETGEVDIVPATSFARVATYPSVRIDAVRPFLDEYRYEKVLQVIGQDRAARRARIDQGDIFVAAPEGMPPEAMGL